MARAKPQTVKPSKRPKKDAGVRKSALSHDDQAEGGDDEGADSAVVMDGEVLGPGVGGQGEDDDSPDKELDFDAVRAEVVDGAEPELSHALSVDRSAPLARYDPLQAYMRDVQRYKLLTPQE
jgi:RNA polymerase sigma-32 factor